MKIILFKVLLVVFYLSVLLINYLANSLPFNNRSTGEISDAYPTLFTPAGFTFSIWGVIYILLGVFVAKAVLTDSGQFLDEYSTLFIILFLVTCVTNILWLFCWHYDRIGLSLLVMTVFLIVLLYITFFVKDLNYLTKISMSVYTGWISIAFIANVTIFLVKQDIPFFQNNEVLWYVMITIIGVIIGLGVALLTKNLVYVAVFIWAYFGIFMKHYQKLGYYLTGNFNIYNLILLAVLVTGSLYVFLANNFKMIN